MKRACQVQRASRKPQHATKPMTTLCESGAALARPGCKPQAATRARNRRHPALARSGCKPQPQPTTRNRGRPALARPGCKPQPQPTTRNRSRPALARPGCKPQPQLEPATTAARLCESQTQRATASRKPQPRSPRLRLAGCGCGLHLARAVQLAATPAWLARGRCNPHPRPAIRNRGRQKPAHVRVVLRACN